MNKAGARVKTLLACALCNKQEKRKMPTKEKIKEYWSDFLCYSGKFDSLDELFEADYCFACGRKAKTERAHIVARVKSKCDHEANLHLLCYECHEESECIDDVADYFQWFENMHLFARLCGGLHYWKAFEQTGKYIQENFVPKKVFNE